MFRDGTQGDSKGSASQNESETLSAFTKLDELQDKIKRNELTALDLSEVRVDDLKAEVKAMKELMGHSKSVYALTMLPGGELASGSLDEIKLWNVKTGECVRTLSGHKDSVYALTVLPVGELASGSRDDTIKLWNVKTGECVRTLKGHSNSVYALTVLPGGELASGTYRKIKLWNVKTGECVRTLSGHKDSVYALTVLPGGELASGSRDDTIKLWNVKTGECVRTLSGHSDSVFALTVLPGGELASGSYRKIKLWNVKTGDCVRTLSGHSDHVRALTVLPGGELASGSHDNTIKLWNVKTGECVRTLSGHSDYVRALTVLPGGELASGSDDRTIKLWNTAVPQPLLCQDLIPVIPERDDLVFGNVLQEFNTYGLSPADSTQLQQTLTAYPKEEIRESLQWIKQCQAQWVAIESRLSTDPERTEIAVRAKAEQAEIDKFPALSTYQHRLQQELAKFMTAYWLATSGIFKLADNKKGIVLNAVKGLPMAGSFLSIFVVGFEVANEKYRFYQINRLAEVFTDTDMVVQTCRIFSRQMTLAKADEIKAQKMEERVGMKEKALGFFHDVAKCVGGQLKEWKTTSHMTGVKLQPCEGLALLDGSFLLDQILQGKESIGKTTNAEVLAKQFLQVMGINSAPQVLSELKDTGLSLTDLAQLQQSLTTLEEEEMKISLAWIKQCQTQWTVIGKGLDENPKLEEMSAEAKAEQAEIDKFPALSTYQHRLQQELAKFMTAYWLATSGIFKLADNKKGIVLNAVKGLPMAGSFLSIFVVGFEVANEKYRFYQINRLAEVFTDTDMIVQTCRIFSRQMTLAKADEIKAQKMEERVRMKEKALGFFHDVAKCVGGQLKEWKTTSHMTGVKLQPCEGLALLDGSFLLDQILQGKESIGKTTNAEVLAKQFLQVMGINSVPRLFPALKDSNLSPFEAKEAKATAQLHQQCQTQWAKIEAQLAEDAKEADGHPLLLAYQRRLQQELTKFMTAYWLATSGVFKLEGNKKGIILNVVKGLPMAGSFLSIFVVGFEVANEKYRFYQINRLAGVFTDTDMIVQTCRIFSRQMTLAKADEIKAQKMEERVKMKEKALGFFHDVTKCVDSQLKEWKTTSHMTGVKLQPCEGLALLDGSFLLDQILQGKESIGRTTNADVLAKQFLRLFGIEFAPLSPTSVRYTPSTVPTVVKLSDVTVRHALTARPAPPIPVALATPHEGTGNISVKENGRLERQSPEQVSFEVLHEQHKRQIEEKERLNQQQAARQPIDQSNCGNCIIL